MAVFRFAYAATRFLADNLGNYCGRAETLQRRFSPDDVADRNAEDIGQAEAAAVPPGRHLAAFSTIVKRS
jgi:hypothetical protein